MLAMARQCAQKHARQQQQCCKNERIRIALENPTKPVQGCDVSDRPNALVCGHSTAMPCDVTDAVGRRCGAFERT